MGISSEQLYIHISSKVMITCTWALVSSVIMSGLTFHPGIYYMTHKVYTYSI